MDAPQNNYEALVLALKLAIDAPSDEKRDECVAIAENLADGLTELELARAKREASEGLEQ
tara:strand:+ start:577 stop:756 length:180 start_codon:yes stop_codon:yes gene_type:complete